MKLGKDRTKKFNCPEDMCSNCHIFDNGIFCTFVGPYTELIGYCCAKDCAEYDPIRRHENAEM